MGDTRLLLIIGLPLVGAALSALPIWVSRRDVLSPFVRFWLDGLALLFVCAGIAGAGVAAIFTPDATQGTVADVGLSMTPLARVTLPAVCGALILSVLFSWRDDSARSNLLPSYRLAWAAAGSGAMLAGAMLAESRVIQGLLLFAIALAVAGVTLAHPRTLPPSDGEDGERAFALGLAGGLKHIGIAATGTALLLMGALALAQYGLNLENRALLQLGVGMLAVGLVMRVGAMPFAGAYGDLTLASPGLGMLALGAVAPGAMAVGLLMLAPVESASVAAQSAGWLGALSTLIAGLRSLGAGSMTLRADRHASAESDMTFATLATMTVAAQIGWALAGVLSGSHAGAVGATLLIINLALAVPLILASGTRQAGIMGRIGRAAGIASLLGLPPLGGAVGTLAVAQVAANHSGWWLSALLVGTLLTGAGWLLAGVSRRALEVSEVWGSGAPRDGGRASDKMEWNLSTVMILILITGEIALFVASGPLAGALEAWADVPWLGVP